METTTMIKQLEYTAKKHENDRVDTFGTNITAMCHDIIPKLAKLARYEAAEAQTNEYVMNIEIKEASEYNVTIKQDTHIVIKRDDARKYLSSEDYKAIARFLHTIAEGRLHDGKQPANSYYICNCDEPYAESVRNTILQGEAVKTSSNI